ncbi:hypothetical protein JCM11251_003482 [Rhodosporidiobolus azoricus]
MPRKGSKRRKTRTHVKPADNAAPSTSAAAKTPKSFVVKSGTVGGSVSQLTKDVRRVLEPNTATRLRERKANRLRDYVSMSGPLGVTHLMVFSQPSSQSALSSLDPSSSATTAKAGETGEERAERTLLEGTTTVNLRLIRLPRGPTLNFKVLRYSLAQDVLRMARRPRAVGREFAEAPLLILSGFGGEDKQLKLMTTVFQNLFPPIHVQTMALSSARRVVLLSYNSTTHTIDFRHYLISVRQVGISKPIRKIIGGSTNNKVGSGLSSLLSRKRPHPGGTSESEASEDEGANNGAMVPRPAPTKSAASRAKGVLDLSRAEDISDYILRQESLGFVTSDSEVSDMSDAASSAGGSDSEADEKKGKVRLAGDYVGRGNRGKGVRGEKRAVRLVELGPRMELGLVKVEEGVGEGEVMFHEMVHKTNREASELAKVHAARRKLAAERRAQQEANVAAKKAANAKNGKAEDDDDEEEMDEEDKIDSDIEFDYEKEHGLPVGEEGDEELLDDDSDEEGDEEEEDVSMARDSSAGESDKEEEDEGVEEWDDEDDSDTDPIPLSEAHLLDELPPPKAKPQQNKRRAGPASFSAKQFKRVDPSVQRQAIMPRGLRGERPQTKKQKQRAEEQEKRANRGKPGQPKVEGRARYEDLQANKEVRAGAGGGGGGGDKKKRGARGKGGKGKK